MVDNTLDAAIDAGVKYVICLSTDKAAYPTNAMGITKAIEEKVTVIKSRYSSDTKIYCTSYGNVMRSRDSVISLWINQIRQGHHNSYRTVNDTFHYVVERGH